MAEPDHEHSADVTRNPGRKGDNPAAERGVWRPGHAPGTGPGRGVPAAVDLGGGNHGEADGVHKVGGGERLGSLLVDAGPAAGGCDQ